LGYPFFGQQPGGQFGVQGWGQLGQQVCVVCAFFATVFCFPLPAKAVVLIANRPINASFINDCIVNSFNAKKMVF
jgi:hypothetical protein